MTEWAGYDLGDDFPAEVLESDTVKNLKENPGTALKSLVDAQRQIGRSVVLPKPDADGDAWSEVFGKVLSRAPDDLRESLSVPDKPDGYGIAVPEGMDFAAEPVKQLLERYQAAGLTREQAGKMIEPAIEALKEANEAAQKAAEGRDEAFSDLWGNAVAKKQALAEGAVAKFWDEDEAESVLEVLKSDKIPTDVAVLLTKGLAAMGEALGEDNVQYLRASRQAGLTPEAIQDQLDELEQNELYQKSLKKPGTLSVSEQRQVQRISEKRLKLREQMHRKSA